MNYILIFWTNLKRNWWHRAHVNAMIFPESAAEEKPSQKHSWLWNELSHSQNQTQFDKMHLHRRITSNTWTTVICHLSVGGSRGRSSCLSRCHQWNIFLNAQLPGGNSRHLSRWRAVEHHLQIQTTGNRATAPHWIDIAEQSDCSNVLRESTAQSNLTCRQHNFVRKERVNDEQRDKALQLSDSPKSFWKCCSLSEN